MKPFWLQHAAIGLVIAGAAATSLLSFPDARTSTYVAALALTFGVASVILMSWRNALPTDTVGQLLQRTETGDRPGRTGVAGSDSL